ncbi:hypothetical protein [Companilactobacillus furfuricola]|uniref:hypothetical protein n=1 Tax=Companilactobacillus furfuricola TaxID=1462575 RepID=UPI000F7B6A1A|nr:hypothetical protein [Companilactobacillus furfuricola]
MFAIHDFIGFLLVLTGFILGVFLLFVFCSPFHDWVKRQSGGDLFLIAFILSNVLSVFTSTGLSGRLSSSIFLQILIILISGFLITAALIYFSKKHSVNWTLVFLIATPVVALIWILLENSVRG